MKHLNFDEFAKKWGRGNRAKTAKIGRHEDAARENELLGELRAVQRDVAQKEAARREAVQKKAKKKRTFCCVF